MISAPDRRKAVILIEEARQSGARLEPACKVMGITARTFQRWTRDGGMAEDRRPYAEHSRPPNKLSVEERNEVLAACHEFASLPPSQIVPMLADQGRYLASESSFYRILREVDEQHHRGRSKAPRKVSLPTTHRAEGPCEVWTWDITWLPGPVKGLFFYLYLVLDIYSRKIVGWEIFEEESAAHASVLIRKAVMSEGCQGKPLVLHADNGSPMKGSTMLDTLRRLGVVTSYSRPRVSNDNAFPEALFRTCKYRPSYPEKGFSSLEDARGWTLRFVRWYNREHHHSGIRFVTPQQRHEGEDKEILARRHALYEKAKARYPERWTRKTRNWNPIGGVWLNPAADKPEPLPLPQAA